MNCLKEIFSNMLHLIKQGSEITLDIKIGIVQIMNNNKLMFRNYNPDVKIRNKRNMSNNETFSERSGAPTSVATPLTNMSSTMSYRGQSQNMARTLNHVGIKRSGPAYEYNAELQIQEGEKIYYRHKKNPYNHLESFINDERFEIENKIQEIRKKERELYVNDKKKNRRVMSSNYYSSPDMSNKNRVMNNRSAERESFMKQTPISNLNKTAILKSVKGSDLNGNEPSSVNDKLPAKFFIDYPNFLKPAIYTPYRRLEEYHIADVLDDARKRYENQLLKKKSEDNQYDSMFFKSVDAGKKVPIYA
jgi:hypothetical protein